MNTLRNTALATLLAIGTAAGAAQAESFTEPNLAFHAPRTAGSVVGGGVATLIGGGDEMKVLYSGRGTAQVGRAARAYGDAGQVQVEYLEPAPAGRGRPAMLTGGDGNTVVHFGTVGAGQG